MKRIDVCNENKHSRMQDLSGRWMLPLGQFGLFAVSAEKETHVGNCWLLNTISTGNLAKVKLAWHILTHKEVAMTIVDKTRQGSFSLQKLSCNKKWPQTNSERQCLLQSAVISKFIVHRDIKAETRLLDADVNIKIADFSSSNEFLWQQVRYLVWQLPLRGPELFQRQKYDGPAVDVCSVEIILYTLVSRSPTSGAQKFTKLWEQVLRGQYHIPFYMSIECENLLKKFLILIPSKRSTLGQIMKD
ncbi:hypothetical protein HPG69_005978 [Diceros bicornis minor]|uniref:non-specific serine/threonine protein kinase n=1 Tax=Diceros bicornis minor TaxID=77932 RepID=A0A7J7ET97_DICBM|nr:hypothetical protein HPG69_005978 [Diceros bicornis minor]